MHLDPRVGGGAADPDHDRRVGVQDRVGDQLGDAQLGGVDEVVAAEGGERCGDPLACSTHRGGPGLEQQPRTMMRTRLAGHLLRHGTLDGPGTAPAHCRSSGRSAPGAPCRAVGRPRGRRRCRAGPRRTPRRRLGRRLPRARPRLTRWRSRGPTHRDGSASRPRARRRPPGAGPAAPCRATTPSSTPLDGPESPHRAARRSGRPALDPRAGCLADGRSSPGGSRRASAPPPSGE